MSDLSDKAIAKLEAEFSKINNESKRKFAKPCIDFLKNRCGEDTAVCEDILQEHKTWEKCYQYVFDQAKKELNNSSGPVCHETVFEWVEDYFHLDDKAIEEQKAKEAVERKAKLAEANQKAKKMKGKAPVKKKTESEKVEKAPKAEISAKVPEEKPVRKKKTQDIEGQMDLFSMMGGMGIG